MDSNNITKTDEKNNQPNNFIEELLLKNELFCATDDGSTYIEFKNNLSRVVWPLDSARAVQMIRELYYDRTKSVPDDIFIKKVISVLKMKANKNPKQKIYHRIGRLNDKIYIDIADENHSYVEIDSNGWRIIYDIPIKFVKTTAMLPLALPMAGGSIFGLRKFMNLESDEVFPLAVGYLIGCLYLSKEYPVLILQGPQGSAKTTTSEVFKHLIDLTHPKLRSLPRNEKDIYIAAKNGHLLCYDNLSGISSYISDSLCRIATGCANSSRELYTNSDEVTIDLSRPIIINGIDDLTTRPDLADRSIVLNLPKISDEKRKLSSSFWNEFEELKPYFMGQLFDAVSRALADRSMLKLKSLPRMADFCLTACAGLQAFGYSPEVVNQLILSNKNEIALETIELNCVARAIRDYIKEIAEWVGTATELFEILNKNYSKLPGYWPKAPSVFSRNLHRIAPSLKAEGIEVDFQRIGKKRSIVIKYNKEMSHTSSCHAKDDDNDGMTDVLVGEIL